MKEKCIHVSGLCCLVSLALQAKDKDVAVVEALLKRLLPLASRVFSLEKLKGEKDCFYNRVCKDKIVIGGNNANSMAMGLNHYFEILLSHYSVLVCGYSTKFLKNCRWLVRR